MSQPVVNSYQPSLTEWFADIGELKESNEFREEDNNRTERSEFLYQTIGLSYERPETLPARELTENSSRWQKILATRGDEACAIRLVPNKSDLPKLRQRGTTIKDCYENWFLKQDIYPDDYTAFICPHSATLLWSAIFVITGVEIYGEIIRGMHAQLTHGDTKEERYQFEYDFKNWQWSKFDEQAQKEIQRIISLLLVGDVSKQRLIKEKLNAEFSHDYLVGYFEATIWPDNHINVIDYNRFLLRHLPTSWPIQKEQSAEAEIIHGSSAYPGIVSGRVKLVSEENLANIKITSGDILVCENTDVRFLPLMKIAGAIVTDRGGILSHVSIVARELKKVCIVDTKVATKILHDGDLVEVDAERGLIKILK